MDEDGLGDGRTEDWTTTQGSALVSRHHFDESRASGLEGVDENHETGFQHFLNEEVQRQGKRQKWRDRLNRDSKGQLKVSMPETSERDSPGLADYVTHEEEPSRESRKRRTQSWIRNALTPTTSNRLSLRLSRQSTRRSEGPDRSSWVKFDDGMGWSGEREDTMSKLQEGAGHSEQDINGMDMARSGENRSMLALPVVGGDRRIASAATEASSTRAFL